MYSLCRTHEPWLKVAVITHDHSQPHRISILVGIPAVYGRLWTLVPPPIHIKHPISLNGPKYV